MENTSFQEDCLLEDKEGFIRKNYLFLLLVFVFGAIEKHFAINTNPKLVKAVAVVSLIFGVIILIIMIVMFMSTIL